MTILADFEIHELCTGDRPMLEPYTPALLREENNIKILSKGQSSYGYDCTLSDDIKIFTNQNAVIVDPKRISSRSLVDADIQKDEYGARYAIIPPNSYMLGCTVEYFKMPDDVLAICMGKSSLARAGIGINVTPIEPGFEGQVVIEISNLTSLPVKIYVGEGIAQFIFFRGEPCTISYKGRAGKYQGQTGITLSKV